jgi:hypothetical protein
MDIGKRMVGAFSEAAQKHDFVGSVGYGDVAGHKRVVSSFITGSFTTRPPSYLFPFIIESISPTSVSMLCRTPLVQSAAPSQRILSRFSFP